MDKRLALITLHAVKNYGSVLQTYATQCYFEKLGYDVTVLDFRRPWETRMGYWLYLADKTPKGIVKNIMYLPSKVLQYIKFNRFLKKRINLSDKSYTRVKSVKDDSINANVYCTGSDQVWNSGWNRGVIPEYFLNFVEKRNEIKKISFASSFGNSDIDTEEQKIIGSLLRDYDLITVRERKSADKIETLFGIKACEILDPTLQMDEMFWRKFSQPKRSIAYKYILLIQLNRNHAFDDKACEFAHEKDLPLVRLCLRVDQIVLPGKCIVLPEVEQYVELIANSEYVLTDSFHAISFCLNLNKQFYCYYPEQYSERLRNILEITGLEDRILDDRTKMDDKEIDYPRVNALIQEKRREAKAILEGVLCHEN